MAETISFKLKDREFVELQSLLKLLNLVNSGGEAKIRIQGEEVMVNDIVETRRRKKLREGDKILFDGNHIVIVNG